MADRDNEDVLRTRWYATDVSRHTNKVCALFIVAWACSLAACKKHKEDPTVAPAARDTGLVPLQPSNGTLSEVEGLVRAPAPSGDGWECFQQQKSDATTRETLVQCWRRGSPADFVLTLAKDYVVPKSEMLSAEALAKGPYRETNEATFRNVRYVRQGPIDHRGRAAFESELEGVHPKAGMIRKRERVLTHANHIMILSAEGNPDALGAHRLFVDEWFAKTELRAISSATRR